MEERILNKRQLNHENGYNEPTTTEDYIYEFLYYISDIYFDWLMDKYTQYEFCNEIQYIYNNILGKSGDDIIILMNKRNSINHILEVNHIPYRISLKCNRWIIKKYDSLDNFPNFQDILSNDDYFNKFAHNFVKLEKSDLLNIEEDKFSCGYDGLLKLSGNDNLRDFVNFNIIRLSKFIFEYSSEYLGQEFSKNSIENFASDLFESFYDNIIWFFLHYDRLKAIYGAYTKDEMKEIIKSCNFNENIMPIKVQIEP